MANKSAPGGVVVVTFGSADHDGCALTRCPMAPVDWFPDRAAASAHAGTLPEGFEPHILTVSTDDGGATPAGSSPAGVDAVLARQHGAYREALAALVGAVIDVAELYPRAGAELAGAVDHATKVLQHHAGLAAIADNRVVAPGTPFDPAVVASIAADPAVREALQQDADLDAAGERALGPALASLSGRLRTVPRPQSARPAPIPEPMEGRTPDGQPCTLTPDQANTVRMMLGDEPVGPVLSAFFGRALGAGKSTVIATAHWYEQQRRKEWTPDAWPEPGDVVDGRIVRDADDDRPDGA